jgi:hypothetical protein
MGQTAEILAHRFAITRAHADPAKVATSPPITAGPASSRRAGPRPPWQFRRDDLPKDGRVIENQRSYD